MELGAWLSDLPDNEALPGLPEAHISHVGQPMLNLYFQNSFWMREAPVRFAGFTFYLFFL